MSTLITAGLPPVLDETNPSISLGAEYISPDGRKYRFARAGAVALVVGNVVQAPAEDTGDQAITPTATALGSTTFLTSSTMTVTANQYAGGYVTVSVTPDLGGVYKIKSHPAATAAALTFTLEEPIRTAWTTSTRLDFVANPFNGVVACPTTLTSSPVGVAVNDLAINGYGWIQTHGPCNIKNDAAGALTVGVAVMTSSSVAGNVRLQTAGNQIIGTAMTGVASGENGLFFINLG